MKFLKRKDNKKKLSQIITVLVVILIIIAILLIILWQTGYLETFKIAREIQKQQNLVEDDAKVLNQLMQIIDLPKDVVPTMAIVKDAEKLKQNQPVFFAKAKDGDRLIIYPDMAILFDAKANKILHIGPVNFGQVTIGTVSFALYNGTGDENKLSQFEEKLITTFNNVKVNVRENATAEYDETLVIDLIGK